MILKYVKHSYNLSWIFCKSSLKLADLLEYKQIG
jgi:hypothetical protein